MTTNKLEQEFNETIKQINKKIEEASDSLRAANELAKQAGLGGLTDGNGYYYDEYEESDGRSQIDIYPLENAMRESGWSTSSWYC